MYVLEIKKYRLFRDYHVISGSVWFSFFFSDDECLVDDFASSEQKFWR